MRHILIFCVASFFIGCSRPVAEQAPVTFSAETCYAHYGTVPGDKMTELSPDQAKVIMADGTLLQTDVLHPKEWPTDSGSIQFYVDRKANQYWARRVNKMNPSKPDWMQGPFILRKD